MTVEVYRAERGGGKTTWLVDQITDAVLEGKTVAVVVPAANHYDVIARARRSLRKHYRIYTERTFRDSRGYRFDHIYVDDAGVFFEDPMELCAEVAPGVPVTMTYTPFEGSSIPKDVLPERRLNWTAPGLDEWTWADIPTLEDLFFTFVRRGQFDQASMALSLMVDR